MTRSCNVSTRRPPHRDMVPNGGQICTVSQAVRAILLSSAIVVHSTAAAQSAPSQAGLASDEATPLSEIVVTAQRRSENIQDVPMSIEVLDNKKLDQLEIQKFEDYVQYLPSVSTNGANPGFNATVTVRGIVTDGGNIASGSLPTVGQYLDDQPVTTIDGAPDIHMYDIARVEQLSGPQGTLFGASSMGGVLRVITNKPDPSGIHGGFNTEINKFTAGGGFGGKVEAFFNQPFDNGMALRVVGWYTHDGGYIDNVPATRTFTTTGQTYNNSRYAEKNFNDLTTEGGRAALLIPLGERWTVTPSVITQRQTRNGDFSYDPYIGDLKTEVFTPEDGLDHWYQAALTVAGKVGNFDVIYDGAYMDRKTVQHINYADYSYFYDQMYGINPNAVNNAGQNIIPNQVLINHEAFTKDSQEVRITSPATDRLRVLAGAFYQRQYQDIRLDYNIPGLSTEPTPDGMGGTNPPLSVTGAPGDTFLTHEHRIDSDYAVFGELAFDVTSQLTLTGGLRGYRYTSDLSGFFGTYGSEAGSCVGPAIVPQTPCTNLGVLNADGSVSPRTVDGKGHTYRANIQWKFDADHLIYANVSDGFRPGGVNRLGAHAENVEFASTSIPYNPDTLTNYEIGSKNTFWNKRATLNVTAFDEEWKDIQLTILIQGIGLIQNAGAARSRGIEVNGQVNILPGLDISSAATYTKATLLDNYYYGNGISAPAGAMLPFAPEFKGNVIARYNWNWGGPRCARASCRGLSEL